MKGGEVVTVKGCIDAKPGTDVMQPKTDLTTDGRDIGRYWCIDYVCYERTDSEDN